MYVLYDLADSTGLYSFYSQFQNCEIMFHVSTMLPFTSNNRQQVYKLTLQLKTYIKTIYIF